MAQYRVIETSFINNKLAQPGDVVEYEGRAGKNLELIKGKGKAPKADEKPAGETEGEPKEDETGLV